MPGWNFSIGLGSKIKTLFSLQGDAANFMHFSRLFKAQLLSTCGKSHREEGFSEDQLPFLSSLPNIDTNKLNLLKNRLVTKQVSSGLNSLPFFIGHQEFYKDFIVVAANLAFNRYLCDTFISEIIDLNDTKFICADPNESEDVVDSSTIKYFTSILSKLRIIAKFLGFVESLPYKSEVNTLSDKLLNSHISLRCQTTPSFDIKQILLHSISENTVVLTIPWMVIYLSMLDYVTLRLPYYVSMYKIFFELNRFYKPSIKNAYNYNSSLVKFSLGWLFELPHFPDTDYLNFQSSGSIPFIKKTNTLDNCNIIDQNILYICCPYLEEMKKLLTNSSLHNTLTVRHITPVTARESTEVLFKKRSEHQLEEAFFNGQPGSVRKTVEFVSERIASACVKHICNSLVPASKKIALQDLKVFLESWRRDDQVLTPMREKSHKAALKAKVSQMASTSLSALLKKCHEDVSAILSEKLPASIDTLLAIDSLNQTKTACVSIAARMCKERVKQWLNMHVTIVIFKKYFDNEVQKVLNHESKRFVKDKLIFALPSNGNREGHNDNCLSGFHMMEKIKNLSVDVIDDSIDVDEEAILKLLQEASVTLKERCDVNEIITAYICTSLVDFLLLLVIQRGFIMTEDILRLSMKTWVCYYGTTEDLFGNLLCPRNIMLLNQSRNQKSAWYSFSEFVAFLIKHNVISCDNFQNQCTGFFKRNWDQASLDNTCYFLRSFFEFFKQNGDISKFTLLLEFYSEFCSDL
ncbi:hypothetical protein JTB14_003152 [Gonioctena quinquepunctata]|nr:hypothetical protein JTB14_003152 [Gonioctena quinquepunctata]